MSTMRNSVTLIGRPGADPTMKTFENNRMVAHFSLAINEPYQNAQKEWVNNTQWFNMVAWDKMAESLSKYVRKGRRIAVTGRLRTRDWSDAAGHHEITEVQIDDFFLIDRDQTAANSATQTN